MSKTNNNLKGNKKMENSTMTKAQVKVINRLREDILDHDGYSNNYEYKRFEIDISNRSKIVFLATTVGLKNDEGTMASVLARTQRHVAIGPRGGLSSMSGNRAKCKNYHLFLIWGSEN
jgi:hypothetical protein